MVDDFNKPLANLNKAHKTVGTKTLEQVERDYIVQVLEQTNWKVSGENSATEILGLNRSTLRARMRKLDIIKP
jgi:formate hydrogenlyase transcriptional activator